MNRKKALFTVLVTVALAFATLAALPGSAWGDAGGFSGGSSYGGGGGSSYSGGGSSYSGGGSSYSYNYGDDDSSSDGGGVGDVCITIIVVIVILAVFLGKNKNKTGSFVPRKGSGGAQPAGAQLTPQSTLRPVTDLLETDPDFDAAQLCANIANIYVRMQNAWTAKDFSPMRPYFSDTLFTQFDRQLDVMRRNKQTNYVDNIAVLGVDLRGWFEQEGNECMVALVRTRIIDYTKDDTTGNILSQRPFDERFMTYEYTLIRTKGTLTATQAKDSAAINCPNCGAPLDINQSTKCPYCDSIVTAKDHDWVINIIKGISQQFGN